MRFYKDKLHISLQEMPKEVLRVIQGLRNRLETFEKEQNEEIKSLKMQLKNQQAKMKKLENDLKLRMGNNFTSSGKFRVIVFLNSDA